MVIAIAATLDVLAIQQGGALAWFAWVVFVAIFVAVTRWVWRGGAR